MLMNTATAPNQISRALRLSLAFFGVVALVFFLAGCNVKEKQEGDNKKVDIQTPLGNMKVDTNADAHDTGLPVYPGAQLKPGDEHDSNKANVNINTSFFGLKVVAAKYTSTDSPDKIIAYYTGELKKFGDVIQCKGGSKGNVHMNRKGGDDDPVSCDNGDTNGEGIELKVGTNSKQRVVAVKPDGKGSEFSLVYVQTRGKEGAL
jgi:hypothetical protein